MRIYRSGEMLWLPNLSEIAFIQNTSYIFKPMVCFTIICNIIYNEFVQQWWQGTVIMTEVIPKSYNSFLDTNTLRKAIKIAIQHNMGVVFLTLSVYFINSLWTVSTRWKTPYPITSKHTTWHLSRSICTSPRGSKDIEWTRKRDRRTYTHPNFQRPHFQFDTVWLIDHVKLWNFTTLYFSKASLKFFLKFCNLESFGDIMTSHVILTLRHYASHRCSKMYTNWF